MTKRSLFILLAVVVVVGAATVVIVSSLTGEDHPPSHQMQNGQGMDNDDMTSDH